MITVLVLDVDGVLTDGKLYYGPSGEVLKQFHVHDGLAISVFLKAGIQVAVISGRESEPLTCRLDQLGVQHRFLACKDKPKALKQLCQMLGVSLANVAYVGDDLIDLEAMKMVGFAACPADAVADVQQHSHYIAKKAGGCGAVREICDYIAQKNGHSLAELQEGAYDFSGEEARFISRETSGDFRQ